LKFYLRYINPLIALLILLICSWIFFGDFFFKEDKQGLSPFARGENILLVNSFHLYFFAKGLFSASMVFLFGEFFRRWLDKG